jgi:hypothetical protein
MGQEARCLARIGEHHLEVKALLETDELILRGEHRRRLPFASLDSVEAADGRLTLERAGETVVLVLGPLADRWARKIRNPPTLLDKLGVKAGQRVGIVSLSDASLRADLAALANVADLESAAPSADAEYDLVFVEVDALADLDVLTALRHAIAQDGAVWVVHPKGRADLKDVHVIEAGRAACLTDNKVARISDRLSALRFVIPRAQRRRSR